MLRAAVIGAGAMGRNHARVYAELDREPYRSAGYSDYLPVAERVVGEVLSLPVHPALTAEELGRIVEEVNRLC
jgi:dTDP-4-amino-4,6-dideoxygalactose transaminase